MKKYKKIEITMVSVALFICGVIAYRNMHESETLDKSDWVLCCTRIGIIFKNVDWEYIESPFSSVILSREPVYIELSNGTILWPKVGTWKFEFTNISQDDKWITLHFGDVVLYEGYWPKEERSQRGI